MQLNINSMLMLNVVWFYNGGNFYDLVQQCSIIWKVLRASKVNSGSTIGPFDVLKMNIYPSSVSCELYHSFQLLSVPPLTFGYTERFYLASIIVSL